MRQAQASVESRGGEVVATVDHAGGLADLVLRKQAMRLPADELAALIVATSRRAQATVARQVGDLARGLYGSDSPMAAFIADTYTEQFPHPLDEERESR